MSRWYVYKDNYILSRQWVAIPVHADWWEKPQGRRFPQWHMAMAYANRMAHTERPETIGHPADPDALAKTLSELGYRRTTIKDPSGAFCELTVAFDSRNFIHLKAGDDTFTLARHEWEPLGRFLLAASKSQEEA